MYVGNAFDHITVNNINKKQIYILPTKFISSACWWGFHHRMWVTQIHYPLASTTRTSNGSRLYPVITQISPLFFKHLAIMKMKQTTNVEWRLSLRTSVGVSTMTWTFPTGRTEITWKIWLNVFSKIHNFPFCKLNQLRINNRPYKYPNIEPMADILGHLG